MVIRMDEVRFDEGKGGVDVSVVMGSSSDWSVMKLAVETLEELGVSYESGIVSAHRTPDRLYGYAKGVKSRGLKVVIAGAGGAAHLPGMIASLTEIPVLGVPIMAKNLMGMDSLFSMVQMPKGVPVATFAIGESGAINAALFAASMLARQDRKIDKNLNNYRSNQTNNVGDKPF